MSLKSHLEKLKNGIENNTFNQVKIFGKVSGISKSVIECKQIGSYVCISEYAHVILEDQRKILCQVIEIKNDTAFFLPFEDCSGVKIGDTIAISNLQDYITPHTSWLGRVIDGFATPKDNKGPLSQGKKKYWLDAQAPTFDQRNLMGQKISLGTRIMDIFTPICKGQRIGIFGGSGLGKSSLIGALTKYAQADIKIVGFIGERSREINEFLDDYFYQDENVIVVASSSEQSPLVKKRAAYLTMSLAEYFSDQGLDVLCMMDSVTRFAMAQRDISLAAGRMPISKGYTSCVFKNISNLLERAGPRKKGNITGLFTVLVEGNDHDEPISDNVRATLDGHIVLDKNLAEQNIFPAINIFKSISRITPKCYDSKQELIVKQTKEIIKTYRDMEDMIKLGIYKKGSNTKIDNAINLYNKIIDFFNQPSTITNTQEESFSILEKIIEKQD